jgi:RimJ/RimL family protein N-acetyltransferase
MTASGVRLADGVVALRPWELDDAPELHRLVADPEILRFTRIPGDATLDERREWLAGCEEGWASGMHATWAITDAAGKELIGAASVQVSLDDPAVAEIGYWVAANSRRRGVARRAVELVAAWAFDAWSVARLEILTAEANVASQRVALTSGFIREGVLRAYRQHGEGRYDMVMFSRLKDDPAES